MATTIYVSSLWENEDAFSNDSTKPADAVWGTNAFATTKAAYMAARDLGGEITIDLSAAGEESLDGTVGFGKAGKDGVYTITGGNGRNTTSYGISTADTNITVKFEDAAFKIAKAYFANSDSELIVDNSVIGTAYYSGHNSGWFTAGTGTISINDSIFGINYVNFTDEQIAEMARSASNVKAGIADGTYTYWATGNNNSGFHMGTADSISVTDSTMSATWISIVDRGLVELDNSVLYYGAAISIGAGQVDSSLGQYNSNEIGWDAQIWWNPVLSSDAGFREGEVATLNITDSIVRNIGSGNGNDGAHVQVGGSYTNGITKETAECAGVLNLKNSEFYITPYDADGNAIEKEYDFLVVKGNGTVNMEDSKLVTAKVINEGAFTVTGESTIIAEIAGSAIDFADGATLVDSNINYTGSDSFGLNGVTFKGDNTINAGQYGVSGAAFTVSEGASLTAIGGRWALGSNANWDINGTIADAKALTADEIAALKASLTVAGLSLSTYGGDAVMDVDNAYVVFSNYVSNKNTNASGGTITMDFNNSIVKSDYKYSVGQTKSGYDAANAPAIALNLTNSVFDINNYFVNNHANGSVTADNSILKATAFGNVGTFVAENGSEVEFSLVNNALGDWQGKGSLNAGSMTVDASEMTINNTGATLEFYNVGTIDLKNGATLNIDKLYNSIADDLEGSGKINEVFAGMTGTINVEGATLNAGILSNTGTVNVIDGIFKADQTINDATFLISGESTVQIEDATGSGWSFRVADGAVLNDSYIKSGSNATTRLLGSATFNGGYSTSYLQGAPSAKDGVGGTLTINDDATINVSYGVEFSNDYTLNGGKIVLSGGKADGSLWGCVFQNATFEINTDIEVDGLTGDEPVYASIHFTNAVATVTSDIVQKNPRGEVIYISSGSAVTVDGGSLTSETGIHVTNSTLDVVNGGELNSSITVNEGGIITIDGSSLVTASTITSAGSIVVDATDFSGFKKIIDVTAEGAEITEEMVTFENADGVTAIFNDGDLYLASADNMSTIYVDSTFTGDFGADLGDGKIMGVNAFNVLDDAVAVAGESAKSSDDVKLIIEEGSVSAFTPYVFMTVAFDEAYFDAKAEEGTYALDVNGTLSGSCLIVNNNEMTVSKTGLVRLEEFRTYGGNVTVNGNNTEEVIYGRDDLITNEDGTPVTGFGGYIVPTEKAQISACVLKAQDGGSFVFNDTDVVLSCSGNAWGHITDGSVSLDNTYIYVYNTGGYGNPATMYIGEEGSLTSENSGIVSIQDGLNVVVNNSGTIELGAESYFDVKVENGETGVINAQGEDIFVDTIDNNGTFNVDNSDFTANSVTNGTNDFIVTGESSVNINTLDGRIYADDSASFTDSYIGGRVDMIGGEINWSGENTVTGILSAGYTNYNEDLTVNITGEFTNSNLLLWGGNNGAQTTVNIGSADADRTTFNGGQIGMFEDYTLGVADAILNITNADVTYNYTFIRSKVNIKDSTFTATSVNTYVAGNAKVVVDNSTWDTTAGGNLDIGCYGADYNRGNANVTIQNNSVIDSNKIRLENTDDTGYVVKVAVDGSTVLTDILEIGAGAAFTVTGESTIKAAVSGDGWIYMDNATLDADTEITGGKIRFTNGTSTLDGATVDGNAFQVGIGAYQAVDTRDEVADVVVNVTNGAKIGAVDVDYNGWIGTGWFETDETKAEAMTDARYTLNVDKSIAEFGYLHVSNDGILNVSGNADAMASYTGVDYSFYAGRYMVNGVATFDNVDALVLYTNVSCDNGTEDAPGKLVIKNGANYVSYLDSTSTNETFKISKTGIVEVDNATLDVRHSTIIYEDASLTIKNEGSFTGKLLTNNGTITVSADSFIEATTLAGTGDITIDAADFSGVKKVVDVDSSADFTGTVTATGNEEAYTFVDENGDIFVSTIATDTIYVNSEWADSEIGTDLGDGKYFGVNAFAEFTDNGTNDKGWSNLLVLPEDTTEVVLTAGNENASYGMLRPTQSITVKTEGEGYAVIDRFVNMGCDLTFAEGSKVKVIGNVGLSGANNQGGTVTINGEVYMAIDPNNGNKALYLWGMNDTPGELVINAGGILKADCANVENHGTITVYGTMELGKLGDAPKLAGVGANNGGWHGHLIVDGKDGEGIVSVAHNQLNFGGGNTSVDWQEPAGDCSVDIINGGKITTAAVSFRNGAKNTLTINNGTLEFTNDPDYANLTPRYFDNQGEMNVSNSTINMTGRTFANDGVMNFTGENTLKITALNGNAVKFDNATLSADSTIGGNAVLKVYGESVINGTVANNIHANWAGEKVDNLYAGYTTDEVVLTLNDATATGLIYVGSDTEGYGAALNVNSSTIGHIYNRTQGSVEITGADNTVDYISNKGSLNIKNAENTYIEALVAEGSQIVIADSDVEFAIGTSNCIELTAGTAMTVLDSTVKFQAVSIDAASMLTLSGTTVNVDGVYDYSGDTITNNGLITLTDSTIALGALNGNGKVSMDTASQIIWSGNLAGSFTIDVSGFDREGDAVKLFDYTGSETIEKAYYEELFGTLSNSFYVGDGDDLGDLYYNLAEGTHTVVVEDDYVIPEGTDYIVVDPGAGETLKHEDTNLAVDGIEAEVNSGTFEDTVSGGEIVTDDGTGAVQETEYDTDLTINDGTFNKVVMGGSRVEGGSNEHTGDSNLTINGGTFADGQVAGGMAYSGTDESGKDEATLIGDINLTINGGSFETWIYGGSIASSSATSQNTVVDGNITITIDASVNQITFGDESHIVAGSYQKGIVTGDTQVILTGNGANLGMDADNLIWGGSSADVYQTDIEGNRTFVSAVQGNRTFVFDDFEGSFTARIRGFNTFKAEDSQVSGITCDLADIKEWIFDTDSSISGRFSNDFAGDRFEVDVTDWDNEETTLYSGGMTGFEFMDEVVLGGEEAKWNTKISGYASESYQLTFDFKENALKFSALA